MFFSRGRDRSSLQTSARRAHFRRRRAFFESLEQRQLLTTAIEARALLYQGAAGPDTPLAPDKTALLPGEVASFENYSSYSRGINGIVVDIHELANPAGLTDADFEFRVGNTSDLSMWSAAPSPQSIVGGAGQGSRGSDRITITWTDNAIQNEWLEVTVKRTTNTGLPFDDVFYFGNAVGESGDSSLHTFVNGVDFAGPRDNPSGSVALDNRFDYNRDRIVDGADLAIARDSETNIVSSLFLIAPSPQTVLGYVTNSEPRCGDGANCLGDVVDTSNGQVYLHNGAVHLRHTDLSVPGRGFDWSFQRTYRSDVVTDGPLGANWTHNYDRRLLPVSVENLREVQASFPRAAVNDMVLLDGLHRADLYVRQGDGTFASPRGHFTRLVDNQDGTFSEWLSDGRHIGYHRATPGDPFLRMGQQADRNGNVMSFGYDPQSFNLTQVVDTMGRVYDYAYDLNGRLTEVRDFSGRTIRFAYDQNGDLVSVTSPAVVGTPNDNDFPQGKTESYSYSSGFADPRLNHNLVSITAPNENALGGPPRIVNEFLEAPQSQVFDRVLRHTYGGNNASAVPAGGLIQYQYELLGGDPSDPSQSVLRNTVLDANGNLTEYEFNSGGNILRKREFTNRNIRNGDPSSFDTQYVWNLDYQLERIVPPAENEIQFVYDQANPDRLQHGNLLEMTVLADPVRRGDQQRVTTTWTYEPVYNQIQSVTEPRGNDPAYVPQNGGTSSAARYTTTFTYDYQEGNDVAGLAARVGVTEAEMQQRLANAGTSMGLGDVNLDGNTTQISGNSIRTQYPTVNHLPGSNQAAVEGDALQEIIELRTYDELGHQRSATDPEGNVDLYFYFPETDPDGDGTATPSPPDGRTLNGSIGGYLNLQAQDVFGSPERNSNTNPATTNVRRRYLYDPVGNVVREIDGRGIATDYAVNELNQVVQVTTAAAHNLLPPSPSEPLPLTDFEFRERLFYDFNDNLVRRQVEDRGNTSLVDGNPPAVDEPPTAQDADPVGGEAFVDTVYEYDILDNLTETIEEVANGTIAQFLHTRYRYDANGNGVMVIHPAGNADSTHYDERDLVFRTAQGAFGPPPAALMDPSDPLDYNERGGLPCQCTTYRYDGNGNLIESVDADDTDLSPANNSPIGPGDRTRYVYDGLDRLTSEIDSVGNQIVYQYDPAGNLVRTSRFGPVGGASPIADGPDTLTGPVSENGVVQANNLVNGNLLEATEYLYDELSRRIQTDQVLFVNTIGTTRVPDVADGAADLGKGDLTPGDNQPIAGLGGIVGGGVNVVGRVSTQVEYDRKSRISFTVEDDGDVARILYDGRDRIVQTTDPENNIIRYAYDDNDNLIETAETDVSQVPGVADETYLTTYLYDSLNRLTHQTDNVGQTTFYRYDSRGNLVATADAQGPVTGSTITRRAFPDGALTVNTTNDFGNVARLTYDGINRLVARELVLTNSGEGSGTHIGASTEGVKDDGGVPESFLPSPDLQQGGGDGIIRTGYFYDDNSLLSTLIDDSGNVTLYLYDNLNRRVAETSGLTVASGPLTKAAILGPRDIVLPSASTINNPAVIAPGLIDRQLAEVSTRLAVVAPFFSPPQADFIDDRPPTTIVYGYAPDDHLLIQEDANDNETFTRYDAIGRPIHTRIFRSGQADNHVGDPDFAPQPLIDPSHPSVVTQTVGTTVQNQQYDGLSRLTQAFDNNNPANPDDDSVIQFAYDSLSRVIEETQQIGVVPPHTISSGWRAENLRSSVTYPNTRSLQYTYDALDRIDTVADTGAPLPIVDYDYLGSTRVLVRAYPENGTRLTYLDDTGTTNIGYDGLRRPIQLRHLRPDNSLIVGFQYDYDRMNNKVTANKLHDPENNEHYSYDSAYRLIRFERPEPQAVLPLHNTFQLDGAGNWQQVDFETRQYSSINELITQDQTAIGGGLVSLAYDDNGNQTANGHFTYAYDALNRLRTVERSSDGQTIATYTYDAIGRRIEKAVTAGSSLDGTTRYYYDASRTIEERDAADTILNQFVAGAQLVVDKNLNGDATATGPGDQRFYYHDDNQGSIFALTDLAGTIVEAYQYHAYGAATIINPGTNGQVDFGGDDIVTAIGISQLQPYLFQGMRVDSEHGLYYTHARYYDPFQGRFLSRDPIGIWGDPFNLGNGYSFVGNNPINRIDPSGRRTFAVPHMIEASGDILTATNTFDTQIYVTYTAGQADVATNTTISSVDLFIFDEVTGNTSSDSNADATCGTCHVPMSSDGRGDSSDGSGDDPTPSPRKRKVRVDNFLGRSDNHFDDPSVILGYVIVVASGDTDHMNITSAVVNARSGPGDLAVFIFEPQVISAKV